MFTATSTKNTPNARFNGLASIECASFTPQGAVTNVIAMMIPKAIRLTAPMVRGGTSIFMSTNKNPITAGTAMTTPKPAAVATARRMVVLKQAHQRHAKTAPAYAHQYRHKPYLMVTKQIATSLLASLDPDATLHVQRSYKHQRSAPKCRRSPAAYWNAVAKRPTFRQQHPKQFPVPNRAIYPNQHRAFYGDCELSARMSR